MVFVTTDLESLRPFVTLYYDSAQDGQGHGASCGAKKRTTPQARRQFPIDVRETETCYVICADLPGYGREQVAINFDDGERTLHILAKRPAAVSTSGDQPSERAASPVAAASQTAGSIGKERWLRRERPDIGATECERYIELPADAVAEQAHASLVDGVLQVEIPRQLPKRYQIQLA